MATTTSRPSTTSAKIRSKTSELSELFRGRQHSSVPSPSADPSNKSKRKIPLFGLRKKSPVAPPGQRSPTLTPVPTPRPSTNVYVLRLSIFFVRTSHFFLLYNAQNPTFTLGAKPSSITASAAHHFKWLEQVAYTDANVRHCIGRLILGF